MTQQTKVNGRQWAQNAIALLGIAQIGAGNEVLILVKPGDFVRNITLDTQTAFNSATTTTATVSDGTTTFVNAVDIKSTGRETVANVGKYYPNGGTLTVSLAETGATATAGQAVVTVEVLNASRANEFVGQ